MATNPLYDIPGLGGYLANEDRLAQIAQNKRAQDMENMKLAQIYDAMGRQKELQQLGQMTGGDPVRLQQKLLERGLVEEAGRIPVAKPKTTDLITNMQAAGIDPASPQGQEMVKSYLIRGTTTTDKAPTTRVVQAGDRKITQEWINGKWNTVAVGSEKTPAQLFREEQALRKEADLEERKNQLKTTAVNKAKIVINKADDALKKTGFFTTGLTGAVLSKIPGREAYDVDKTIDTIKANIGFQELADMRAASPTGGALGQVAVRELEFLQSTIANLDAGLSYDEKVKTLNQIKTHYQNWLDAVEGREPAPAVPAVPTPAAGGLKFLGFENANR